MLTGEQSEAPHTPISLHALLPTLATSPPPPLFTPTNTTRRSRFAVTDTGPGIPQDKQQSIFSLRSQSGDAASQSSGFGIGLSIAKQLTYLMGGELGVASPVQAGAGSEFSFSLQLRRAGLLQIDVGGGGGGPQQLESVSEPPLNLVVLIVDDVAMNRRMMKRKLTTGPFEELNFSVSDAATGEGALELVDAGRDFDLIITDENMQDAGGVMTGTELTRKLRERKGGKKALIFGCR